jgi:Concanavalin A-like lectin/glucanases superfamily
MIIQGMTLKNTTVWDGSFINNGALLYVDAGQTASYPGTGTTWTDLSTYQNNSTLTNSPTFTNVGAASYFSFNGSNQYAPVTTSKMNVAYTGKTTMFSIRTVNANTGNGIYRNLFGGDSNARNFNTYMYHVSGSTWQMQFSTGPLPWVGPISASFTVADNQWVIVAVTQTTGGVVTYYVNGQQIGTPATGITFTQFINSGTEAIARSDNYWRGDMGVCAVYGRALQIEEIQQSYNAMKLRYGL